MSEGEGEGKVVCVTGASGYIASWLVKLLLHRGYSVKATVRNLSDPRKVVHLKSLEGAKERLRLFEADLTQDGSFDSAIHGCEGVFHLASPVSLDATNPQAEIIDPAVKGTINVLRSCSRVASVRRVVLTSSTAAMTLTPNPTAVLDETWFSDPAVCQQKKLWYWLSKTLAEEAAWKFAKENGIDLVVMNPGLVLGPLLQPTLNLTSEFILEFIEGKAKLPICLLVDVRDVARAHVAAFENSVANGRYLLVGKSTSYSEAAQLLHKLYPSYNCPINFSATESEKVEVSTKKVESLGVSFMPLEESLKDTIESLKEKNFLTLSNIHC